jgi:hypothetical protein
MPVNKIFAGFVDITRARWTVIRRRQSISEEVEDVTEHRGFCSVDFGVAALRAGYGGEAFRLDVEDFGEEAAGGAEFIDFALGIFAFGTGVI